MTEAWLIRLKEKSWRAFWERQREGEGGWLTHFWSGTPLSLPLSLYKLMTGSKWTSWATTCEFYSLLNEFDWFFLHPLLCVFSLCFNLSGISFSFFLLFEVTLTGWEIIRRCVGDEVTVLCDIKLSARVLNIWECAYACLHIGIHVFRKEWRP